MNNNDDDKNNNNNNSNYNNNYNHNHNNRKKNLGMPSKVFNSQIIVLERMIRCNSVKKKKNADTFKDSSSNLATDLVNQLSAAENIFGMNSVKECYSALNIPFDKIERVVHNQLTEHLEKYNIIFYYEPGFRSKYSVNTCLAHLSNQILKGSEARK